MQSEWNEMTAKKNTITNYIIVIADSVKQKKIVFKKTQHFQHF
jgi:hypothetical protein